MDLIIEDPENYVSSVERDTTGHGTKILTVLQTLAPDAVYKPRRVIAVDGEFRPSNFLKAMDTIRSGSSDIVNISAGKYHANCDGQCRICDAVEAVISSGTVVVAGAGNRTDDREFDVFCPARSGKTIAVGMSQAVCTATPDQTSKISADSDLFKPPGAYWATGRLEDPSYPSDTYCTGRGCSPFHGCGENKKDTYWAGNVAWNRCVPDVVAPGHLPIENPTTGKLFLEPGTSYSTAYVSACIATVVSEVYPPIPRPQRIARALRSTVQDLSCGNVGKLDMEALRDSIS